MVAVRGSHNNSMKSNRLTLDFSHIACPFGLMHFRKIKELSNLAISLSESLTDPSCLEFGIGSGRFSLRLEFCFRK